MNKIQHRKCYIKKQKKDTTTSKDDEIDLLGEGDGDSFTGSNADLGSAAEDLFTLPPHPQPPPFSSLSLKTPDKKFPTNPRYCLTAENSPALPPHLGADHHIASDQLSSPSEEPSKKASDRPKEHSHSHRKHDFDLRSASDQYNDESDEPRVSPSK